MLSLMTGIVWGFAEQFYCKLSKSWCKPEWGPHYSGEAPPRTSILTSTRLYPFPTPVLPPFFNSKSIELLSGSGEVLVTAFKVATSFWKWPFYSRIGRFTTTWGPLPPWEPPPQLEGLAVVCAGSENVSICLYSWNSLPADLRAISDRSCFKSKLKTYLFQSAFNIQ